MFIILQEGLERHCACRHEPLPQGGLELLSSWLEPLVYLQPGQPPQVAKQVHAGHPLACQPCEKLKGHCPVAGSPDELFRTPVAGELEEPPLDQSHHPQNHPGTEERLLEIGASFRPLVSHDLVRQINIKSLVVTS